MLSFVVEIVLFTVTRLILVMLSIEQQNVVFVQKMLTGEVEVVLSQLNILNLCKRRLPFELKEFHEVSLNGNVCNCTTIFLSNACLL